MLRFFTKTKLRLGISLTVIGLLLLIGGVVGRWILRYWAFYRLYFSNTCDLSYEQRVEALAKGGERALPVMTLRLRSDGEHSVEGQLTLDALEHMHTQRQGEDFLLRAINNDDSEIAWSALELATFCATRCVSRPRDGRTFYYYYSPSTVLAAVEAYLQKKLNHIDRTRALKAAEILREYARHQEADQRYRRFAPSLPESIRREVRTLFGQMSARIKNRVINLTGVPGFVEMQVAVLVFDQIRKKYPQLAEEQLFEVASILGNALGINARYFMLYKDGLPEHGGVIENPGFDIHDTRDNIPDQ